MSESSILTRQRSVSRFPRILLHFARKELPTLIAVLLLLTGLWIFAEIADEVQEQSTLSIDRAILLAMRNPSDASDPLGPRWFEEAARDFTALGGVGVLTFISLASVGFLWLDGKRSAAVFVMTAVGGGLVLSMLLKYGYSRPRPDLVPHGSHVYTSSFPSGHSMMSAATYLTLGVLLARSVSGRQLRLFLILVALLITAAVGASRVYLGVHWPTDVLAGWVLGACWAILCWVVVLWLQRRGKVERPKPEPTQQAVVG